MPTSEAARLLPVVLKRRKWSQRRLEREIPISVGYVNRIIKGTCEPTARVAARIQSLLGIRAHLWGQAPRSRRVAA